MDNDRTIGRTNVRASNNDADDQLACSSSTNDNIAQKNNPLAAAHPSTTSTTTVTAAVPPPPAATMTSPGGSYQWPTSSEYYELSNRIGQGAFASVWRARTMKNNNNLKKQLVTGSSSSSSDKDNNKKDQGQGQQEVTECAIKIMDLEHVNINISDIRLEVQTMRLSSHPNVLVCHTSFVRDTDLWLVTQLMSRGSSLHCLQSARAKLLTDAYAAGGAANSDDEPFNTSTFTYTTDDAVLEGGLSAHAAMIEPESLLFEAHITYILYETLLGLKYIHDNGQIHRDIKAGNLLLDDQANVRIADFGVSSWLIDSGNRREHTTTFVGTPCWMAPEVMEQVDGYDYKADIWSLGITALELCKGYAPYAKFAPMKVLLLTIQEDPPNLETYSDGDDVNMWSKSFRSMIKLCLQKDPSKRPNCQELMAHRHFKPLATADGRAEYKRRTKMELCDVVEDVGKLDSASGDGSSGQLPGATPIQLVSTMKKDRPAGTSWILPGGSMVEASTLKSSTGGGGDFYDQFEQQTMGENFTRKNLKDNDATTKADNQTKEKDDEDDMNDFFDEFEKSTGGENFQRK